MFKSSEMLHIVDLKIIINVSEESSVSIPSIK
jgi:hypothetical protein